MPRYFSDLDNGKTKYVDTVGSELADEDMIPREAIGLLASVFKDASAHDGDRVFVVSVRDDTRIVFTTTLTLRSDWLDAGYGAGVAAQTACRSGRRR